MGTQHASFQQRLWTFVFGLGLVAYATAFVANGALQVI